MADLIAGFLAEVTTTPASGSVPSLSDDLLSTLPTRVLEHPLLEETAWIERRDSGRSPLDASEMVTTLDSRLEFLVGAWLIDQIVPPGLGGSLLNNLQPQMLREADVLAAGHPRNSLLMPRRSAKTTSLWCVLLGRCYVRPVHMAGYSMLTTAKKTTERFRLDIFGPISRQWRDVKTRPVKLINSNGFERVEFDNGSVLAILSPEGDAIRSGAYDTLVLDEGGEPDPEKWDDVIASVVPAFDTRGPGAQLIIAGTGGKYRTGSYFWKLLHGEQYGRLRFGVADDIDPATFADWKSVRPLVEHLHPGLDGLTHIDLIEANYHDLGADLFAREYLGHFGDEAGVDTAISSAEWSDTRQHGGPPESITPAVLVFSVHPGGLWASVGVGWHIESGPADLAAAAWALEGNDDTAPLVGYKLVHHQEGTHRLAPTLYRLSRKLNLPIVYGDSPQEKAIIAEIMAEARPRPRVQIMRYGDVVVSATKLRNGLAAGTVAHWEQPQLDSAARLAVNRAVGKAMLFGIPRHDPDADITGIESFALALGAIPPRDRKTIRVAPQLDAA